MPDSSPASTTFRSILGTAAFCVVVVVLKQAAPIVVPFLLAVVIAVICMPSLKWLRGVGVPTAIAVTVILLGIAVFAVLVPLFVGASMQDFLKNLNGYQERLGQVELEMIAKLNSLGIKVDQEGVLQWFDPQWGAGLLRSTLGGLVLGFGNGLLVLFLVAFMLTEASHFHTKLHSAFPESTEVGRRVGEVIQNIWRYLAIKTLISMATGALIALILAIIGVDYPLLWGFIAFCFNYIPNVGAVIASVPAVALALIQFGPLTALGVAIGYLVINNILGTIIEPRLQGEGLGLSPLVVLLSLIFWYWVLGPVGALLSAPLTMATRIACEAHPDTEWIGILLGPKLKPDPQE